jgi:acetate kinase
VTNFLLVLNAGSSSLKFSVFEAERETPSERWRGQIEGLGGAPTFEISERGSRIIKTVLADHGGVDAHRHALAAVFDWLFGVISRESLLAAGHRVVHGGGYFTKPVLIDPGTQSRIAGFAPLAPLHQPHNLAGIEAVAALAPDLPQVACFDTAFHRTIPEHATTIALPQELRAQGIRRYGFHGLSYENVARALPEHLGHMPQRVVAAHLGNGASLCAMLRGESVETTMGFTALDGLVMGTRGGAIDPGVLLHLMQAHGMNAADLQTLLYHRSGLLGLSGGTNDMRALLASEDAGAKLAVDCFVYRVVREIGAMAAALGGLDALVFTAGIGERSAEIRKRVCARLGWLGVRLDEHANAENRSIISPEGSGVHVLVIPADEEGVIAGYTLALAGRAAQKAEGAAA